MGHGDGARRRMIGSTVAFLRRLMASCRRALAALASVALTAAGAFAAGGCSPAALLNALVPSAGYTVEAGLPYGPDPRQKLDLYVPERSAGAAPVVVFFYGGSWKSGQRGFYRFVGEAFASHGYMVVVPDYRLYPQVRFPAFVRDGARALRWVQDTIATYGGDPGQVVLMGHSAGAHLAALLMLDRRYLGQVGLDHGYVRGFVGYAGPYAFNPLEYESTREVFATAAGADQARPVTFVGGGEPPMLLVHGSDDTTVKPVNSQALAAAVEQAGGRARYLEIPGRSHIGLILSLAAPFRGRDETIAVSAAFLERLTAPAPGCDNVLSTAEGCEQP